MMGRRRRRLSLRNCPASAKGGREAGEVGRTAKAVGESARA